MILIGDCVESMRGLPDQSVHTCVTSPPYFGLRDYGHDGQIGLEPTPDEFVAKLVAVFREVRRVLRDDGTLWLNLGDSYARAGGWSDNSGLDGLKRGESGRAKTNMTGEDGASQKLPPGLKQKDLIGIPWRVAFALQADGWYLRQDIIWHKPNPMPESVRDRCTKAHEYIFLLSKSEKYFYDADAARELCSDNPVTRARNNRADKGLVGASDLHGTGFGQSGAGSYNRKQNGVAVCECVSKLDDDHIGPITTQRGCLKCDGTGLVQTRNRRSVWTVATRPFKGAHFATFPPDLVEPCIKAGCPEGGIVLDPFGGSGTTGLVAQTWSRKFILCELNPEYAQMARDRIAAGQDLFTT